MTVRGDTNPKTMSLSQRQAAMKKAVANSRKSGGRTPAPRPTPKPYSHLSLAGGLGLTEFAENHGGAIPETYAENLG